MKSLRILHIEDDPLDAELVALTLTQAGIPSDVLRVDTKNDLVAALDRETFDLVISDLSLPSFDGRSALEVVRRKYPDIPFIFVSGTIGEEAAIESLLSGATDYVLKQRFGRLVPAVQRAHREAEERKKRKQTEQELALASTQLLHLFENLDDVFFSLDTVQNRILQLSPSCQRIVGQPPDAFFKNPGLWEQCVHPEDRGIMADLKSDLRVGRPVRREFRVVHRDTSVHWLEARLKASIDHEGRLVRVDGVLCDVTDRKQSEERLRASEARYRRLFDGNPQPMWVYDEQTLQFLAVNDAAVAQYGYSLKEFLGMTVNDVLYTRKTLRPSDSYPSGLKGLEGPGNIQHRRKDGTILDVEIATHEMPFLGIPAKLSLVTDITEKKKIQAQLLRTQRIESIGALAAGIAHDLNNILAPILMGMQLLRASFPDTHSGKTLDTLETCARRGADLVRQVLTFGRGVEGQRGALQLRYLVKDVEKILTETMPRSIRITTDLPSELWPVLGDSTQLHQLLMNLSINARDSMAGGGLLNLRAVNTTIGPDSGPPDPGLKPGPYVVLEVSDTGCGIPADILDKIFDPFFTTKPAGQGTGLGLSTSRMIVDWHGGFLSVSSEVGTGTTFTIYLPAQPGEHARRSRQSAARTPLGNGETVLVVDDEAAICHIAQATLEASGYTVITASNGAEGLDLYRKHQRDVRAVVTDMNMPIMDGQTMVQLMMRMNPDLRVVTASGVLHKIGAANASANSRNVDLRKPFTAEELLEAVGSVLKAT